MKNMAIFTANPTQHVIFNKTCGTPLSKRKGGWGAKHSPPNLCPEVETMTNETANEAMLFVILA